MPSMTLDDYTVSDYLQWGRLVKTWATGKNHVGDGNDYPRPTTIEEFKRQTVQAKCGVTVPPHVTKLEMIQGPTDTLVVRLPTADMVNWGEDYVMGLAKGSWGAEYPLPAFYRLAWNGQPPRVFDKEELLAFNDQRVGEYTINNCA